MRQRKKKQQRKGEKLKYTTYKALVASLFLLAATAAIADDAAGNGKPEGFADNQWMLAEAIVKYHATIPVLIEEAEEEIRKIKRGKVVNESSASLHKKINDEYIFYRKAGGGDRRSYSVIRDHKKRLIEDREKWLGRFNERLKRIENGELLIPPVKGYDVGQFTEIPEDTPSAFTINQIIGDDKALGDYGLPGAAQKSILLSGYDMTNKADGQRLRIKGLHGFCRTYKYQTVLGATRTVIVMEPVSIEGVDKLVDYLEGKAEKASD